MSTRPRLLKGVNSGGHSTILRGLESFLRAISKIDGVSVRTGELTGKGNKSGQSSMKVTDTETGVKIDVAISSGRQEFYIIFPKSLDRKTIQSQLWEIFKRKFKRKVKRKVG